MEYYLKIKETFQEIRNAKSKTKESLQSDSVRDIMKTKQAV